MWFLNQILILSFTLFNHTEALALLDAIWLVESIEFTNVTFEPYHSPVQAASHTKVWIHSCFFNKVSHLINFKVDFFFGIP
jgi:hypothetical protein